MTAVVKSSSELIWGAANIVPKIDPTIEALAKDRDVISIAVTPLTATIPGGGGGSRLGTAQTDTRTEAVLVTVVWREPDLTAGVSVHRAG